MNRVALIAASVLLAAGCSNGKPGAVVTVTATPPKVATTSVAAVAVKPTPTIHVITQAEAARHYLQIVAPSNAAIVAMNKAVNADPNGRIGGEVRRPIQAYVTSLDMFARNLLAYQWPAATMPIAQRLAQAVLQDRIEFENVLSTTTDDAATNAWNAIPTNEPSTGIATEMRISLGLPSN